MTRSTRTPTHTIPNLGPAYVTRRQFLEVAGAGILATSLPGCGGSSDSATPSYSQTIDWGERAIARVMSEQRDAAAISVALLKRNNIVWRRAFGKASVDDNKPATIQTRFNIGSVSKVLAGLAGVILQDRGLIDLDTPIVRYLPAFRMLSPAYARITSRHLLSHASGLPGTNGRNIFTFAPVPGYSADTETELLDTHLKHVPGQLAVYCNDGFTLFEQIVLAVTRQTFPDFVETNILAPLNMTNSGYPRSPQPAGEFAYPYFREKQYPQEFVNAFATGGLSTTPSDMMNLAQMFLAGGMFQGRHIVSPAGISAMATDQTTGLQINPSPEWRWGLGWDSVRQPGLANANVTAWEKNGGTAFFASEFFVLPDAQMALMLTGNSGYGGDALAIAEGILMRALQEDGSLGALPATIVNTVPPLATPPDTTDAAGIYGNYKAPLQVVVGEDGSLALNEWSGSAWAPLHSGVSRYRYRSDGWWWSDNGALPSFRFAEASGTDEAGNAYRYRYLMERVTPGAGYGRITLPIAQQLAPRPLLSAAWRSRMGSRWTVTNESPESVSWKLSDNPSVTIGSLVELPGYILFGGGSVGYQLLVPLADDRGGMSVKVPVNHGRDLNEIRFATVNGMETLTIDSSVYAPA
ncbi:serine hydrolase [Cupriavidus basilensis]|uniref:Serine hydrolase n=1 Tax=Cupriavidus basilensis TaxID=68895 RepID=A0ABT6AZS1_9BURK|nr:serine hydrolase domain-containing protein [Cupriavidus basilensis]MDF3837838.1 serine hydrolase [Cupriavidus basilensis]